jgi:hypothetical protein
MSKHNITLERDEIMGFLSQQTLGTDALNALSSIDGVSDPEIISENNIQVQVSYYWTDKTKFWGADDVFAQYGLKRTNN